MANSSSLPKIIPKLNIHFEISGRDEKFPFGPIIEPSPGPTFDIDVAAPEIDVIKSKPVIESSAVMIKKITKCKLYINFVNNIFLLYNFHKVSKTIASP